MRIFEVIDSVNSIRLSTSFYNVICRYKSNSIDKTAHDELGEDLRQATCVDGDWYVPFSERSKVFLAKVVLPAIMSQTDSEDLRKSAGRLKTHLQSKMSIISESKQLNEGGKMGGVGAIHISEIEPTLKKLEQDTGLQLIGNTIGSVGKKEFSGDIDIAISLSDREIPKLINILNKSPIVHETKRGPLVVLSRVEIQGYNSKLKTNKMRSGHVQVDFMIDEDPEWLRTFYHSPSEDESKYKGALRNIAIGALSQYVNRKESKKRTNTGKPVSVERYMFSSKQGLVRIRRDMNPRADGTGYTKSHTNTVLRGPWKRADEIARVMKLGTAKDLNSFETVFAAIVANHGHEIARKVARDMANDPSVQKLGIPEELQSYL